jgi:hypothetical protein
MSTMDDLSHLEHQRALVTAQMERVGPDERVMRIHLESRLEDIAEQVAALALEGAHDPRARASLTFGGRPVVEAGAIEAAFGAEALQAFQRLVSTTAATREGRELNARGPIPEEEAYRLFITGTFAGSFGFELEEIPSTSERELGVLRAAMDETTRLLQATQMDDEAYAQAVSQSNPRVVGALGDFLGLMEKRSAILRLETRDTSCAFETTDHVAAAAERARKTLLNEAEEAAIGFLSGVFLKGRRFEFQFDGGGTINGRIAYTIEDPSVLTPSLATKIVAHLRIVTAGRASREQRTYYLTGVEPFPVGDGPPADG